MSDLIEFLVDNIYIVILIAGFVLSAIGKMKGKGNGGTTMRMPDFGRGGTQTADVPRPQPRSEEHSLPSRQPSAERPQPYAIRRTPSPAARPSTVVEDESYRSVKLQEASQPQEPMKRQPAASTISASAGKSRILGEPDAAALRQAVVWSEVLGPPRSKRPWGK